MRKLSRTLSLLCRLAPIVLPTTAACGEGGAPSPPEPGARAPDDGKADSAVAPLGTVEEERRVLNELLGSQITAQGDQFRRALAGQLTAVTRRGTLPCRFGQPMLSLLQSLHYGGNALAGSFVQDHSEATHSHPYLVDGAYLCVNEAVDITAFNGRAVRFNDPETTKEMIRNILANLPAGTYEIGLPREPYANYRAENRTDGTSRGSWSEDIRKYFLSDAYKSFGAAYVTVDGVGNKVFDESRTAQDRAFIPWYFNEVVPSLANLDNGSHALREELDTLGPVGTPFRSVRENEIRDAFASTRVSELVRVFMRRPGFGAQVASEMESALQRGVKLSFYGDALDHIHLTVRAVTGGVGTDPSRVSIEFDTNRIGLGIDYRVTPLARPDYGLCRASCEQDPSCQAFTYVPPRVQDPTRAYCYLKNALGTAVTGVRGMVSGVRSETGDPIEL